MLAGFLRGAVFDRSAAAAFVVARHLRHDRQLEVEDPQTAHLGGELEPPPDQMSRFLFPNGWRLGDGDGVVVPLRAIAGTSVSLDGWLDGEAVCGATLLVAWNGGASVAVPVAGRGAGRVSLPVAPRDGWQRLGITLAAPEGGTAVLDRVVVAP